MSAVLLVAERLWTCPNCTVEHVTRQSPQPDVVLHVCAGLRGLRAPFVLAGTRAKVEAREREDYVGTDKVQTDANGRPVMSIVTTRPDGEDTIVLAPTVTRSRHG